MKHEEIKIEHDHAMPAKRNTRLYPFDEMEVGDSFFIPEADHALQSSAASAAYTWGKSNKKKISKRAVTGGTRFWRIE